MPRKRSDTQSNQVQTESIGLNRGDSISINIRYGPYFWLKRGETFVVRLDSTNWHSVIPQDITESELAAIHQAALTGAIVKGVKKISYNDKDPQILAKYLTAVDLLSRPRQVDENFKGLISELVRRKKDGGYSAGDIITQVLKKERAGRNREHVVDFLKQALDACRGYAIHYEAEDLGESRDVVLKQSELNVLISNTRNEVERSTGKVHQQRKPTVDDILEALDR